MLNRQGFTVRSLYLALGLALGLYGPLQALVTPCALADSPDLAGSVKVTNPPVTNLAVSQSSQAVSGTTEALAATPVTGAAPVQPAQAGSSPTAPAAPAVDPQSQLNSIFKDIDKSVKKFYPKATVTISNTTMHVEDKCKNEQSFYSDRMVLAPQAGGILCDITLKPGQYKGEDKDRLPAEVQDGFHTNLTMAPYSKLQNKYLLVRMSFPSDIDVGFKGHFEKLVNNFNAAELIAEAAEAKAAAEEAKRKVAADKAAARAAAEQASKDVDVQNQAAAAQSLAAYGATNLAMQQFREGKFKLLLPTDFQEHHSIQMQLARVEYTGQAAQGSFSVSYVIEPRAMAVAEANALFEKIRTNMMQEISGVGSQEAFTTLKDCPGREIIVGSIKGKPNSGATIKLYLAGNYVYALTAIGDKKWLDSQAVNDFFDSFEFFGGWGRWYDSQNVEHWQDTSGLEHWRPADGRDHWWDAHHHEHSQ